MGFLERGLAALGIQLPASWVATQAVVDAEEAERALNDSRVRHRDDLVQADRSGAVTADRREAEQKSWEDRPDVRAARREEHGNDLVKAALKTGDPEIRRLLAEKDSLRLAREKFLREEAERAAAAAAEKENLRRMQRTVRPGAGLEAPPPPGGPSRR